MKHLPSTFLGFPVCLPRAGRQMVLLLLGGMLLCVDVKADITSSSSSVRQAPADGNSTGAEPGGRGETTAPGERTAVSGHSPANGPVSDKPSPSAEAQLCDTRENGALETDDGLLVRQDGSVADGPEAAPGRDSVSEQEAGSEIPPEGQTDERGESVPRGSEISGEDDLGPITREEEQALARMMAAAMDVTARAHGGKTALHLAAQEGKAAMVLALIEKGAQVNAEDQDDFTPLHDAAAAGKTDAVVALLEHSARVNASSLYGFTPLHLAADGGFTATALVLLDKGANIEAVTSNELTPLHCAVINRHAATAEALLRRGANVEAEDTNGATPLHYAASANDANMVRMLLSHKANINNQGNDGNSPLHVAAYDGTSAMVRLLLEYGADPTLKNAEGYTPLQLAEQAGNKQKIQLLKGAVDRVRR